MNNLTQIFTNALAKSERTDNVSFESLFSEVIRIEIEKAANDIINHELTTFLGYERSEQGAASKIGNSRNGFYTRGLNTTFGPITVQVPRDRNGEFETELFQKINALQKTLAKWF